MPLQGGYNPARDLGPRIVAYMAGWHEIAFVGLGSGWWVYTLGPCLGSLFGALAYTLLIHPAMPDEDSKVRFARRWCLCVVAGCVVQLSLLHHPVRRFVNACHTSTGPAKAFKRAIHMAYTCTATCARKLFKVLPRL